MTPDEIEVLHQDDPIEGEIIRMHSPVVVRNRRSADASTGFTMTVFEWNHLRQIAGRIRSAFPLWSFLAALSGGVFTTAAFNWYAALKTLPVNTAVLWGNGAAAVASLVLTVAFCFVWQREQAQSVADARQLIEAMDRLQKSYPDAFPEQKP